MMVHVMSGAHGGADGLLADPVAPGKYVDSPPRCLRIAWRPKTCHDTRVPSVTYRINRTNHVVLMRPAALAPGPALEGNTDEAHHV